MSSSGARASFTPARRPRVLVIAEQCNPAWVSVPLEGWSHWAALSTRIDGHLVTHVRNRADVLGAGVDPERLTTLDCGRLERWADRLGAALRGGAASPTGWTTRTALDALAYYRFEQQVWDRHGPALRAGVFDLVHRLTPLTPVAQSVLASRCARLGVPFVLGPLNGGLPWPAGHARARLREHEWLSWVRGAHRLLPHYRATRRHAAALIVGSRATRDELPGWALDRAVYVPENAVDPARFHLRAAPYQDGPLRVAFVGRLVRYKGADVLLEAAAPLVRAGRVQVDVIGDGPAREELDALVARERLGAGVTFAGWVKHAALQERLARAHVFGFPSVREFGGAVVLEAMALGLVPVVLDYGGPGEHVSPATGVAVPPGDRAARVAGFRAALERLADEPARVRAMGRRARERVGRHFTWAAKADQVLEIYRWALGARGKPDFGTPLADP
jgi:alpha-maltose-1-phosphate synthase